MMCPPQIGVWIADLIDHPLHDDIGRRMQPVIGVHMQTDGDVTHGLGNLERHDLVARRRLGVAEERSTEQPHRAPSQRLEQPLGRVDLERDEASADRRGWDG